MTPFAINSATESDLPILLALIRGLAEFKPLAHELAVIDGSSREALFGERPLIEALLRINRFKVHQLAYATVRAGS